MTWIRTPIALFIIACLAIGGVVAAALVMRGTVRASDAAFTKTAFDLAETEHLRGLRERVSRKTRSYLRVGDDRLLHDMREAESSFGDLLSTFPQGASSSRERELVERIKEREKRWPARASAPRS